MTTFKKIVLENSKNYLKIKSFNYPKIIALIDILKPPPKICFINYLAIFAIFKNFIQLHHSSLPLQPL